MTEKEINKLLEEAILNRNYQSGFYFECDIDRIMRLVLEHGSIKQIMQLKKIIEHPYSKDTEEELKKGIDDNIYTKVGTALTKKMGYKVR